MIGFSQIMKKVFSKFILELVTVVVITAIVSSLIGSILSQLKILLPSSLLIESLGVGIIIFLFGFLLWKLYLRYKLSHSQYLVLIAIIELYLIIVFGDNSNVFFQEFNHFPWIEGMAWVDIFIWLPILALAGGIVLEFFDNKTAANNNSVFVADDLHRPKEVSEQAKKIKELIQKGNFDESFSIGIIGSWGYGKSSFMNQIKGLFKDDDQIIQVHFSPYLNHNEDDVVGEFFNALKSAIQPYSGALSKSIKHYAASITKAYRRGEVKELLNTDLSFSSQSATKLYKNVKELIIKLDRKIVVYIDDLDRLSAREVIQVFKLIRNTSKFPRTFFIVSLDKNMVQQELATASPDARRYIDKFLQLEINLPKIDIEQLRVEFLRLIGALKEKLPKVTSLDQIEKKVRIAAEVEDDKDKNKKCLFDLYINNYRDVKKFYNQIANDLSNVPNALDDFDTNDYLNFALLRLKFSDVYEIILSNPDQILSIQKYNKKGLGRDTEKLDEMDKLLTHTTDVYYSFKGRRELILKNAISDKKASENTEQTINKDEERLLESVSIRKGVEYNINDYRLLLRTLEELFPKRRPHSKALRDARQLAHFLKMRIAPEALKDAEFKRLLYFSSSNSENTEFLQKLVIDNKWNQIVARIYEHNYESKDEVKGIVNLIFYSIANVLKLDFIAGDKLVILCNLLDEDNNVNLFHHSTATMLNSEEKVKILETEFFSNEQVTLHDKIYLIHYISELHNSTKLWGYERAVLTSKALELFRSYLSNYFVEIHKNEADTPLKRVYGYLENFVGSELNAIILDVAREVNIESLLIESIQPVEKTLTTRGGCRFMLDNRIKDMLPKMEDWISYLKGLGLPKYDDVIDEYRQFVELSELIDNKPLKFKFNHLKIPVEDYFKPEELSKCKDQIQVLLRFSEDIKSLDDMDVAFTKNVVDTYPFYQLDKSKIILLELQKEVKGIIKTIPEIIRDQYEKIVESINEKYPSYKLDFKDVFDEKENLIMKDENVLVELIYAA